MNKKIVWMMIIVVGLSTLVWIVQQKQATHLAYYPEGKVLYTIEEKDVYDTIGVDVSLLKQFHIAFSLLEVEKSGMILLEYDKTNKVEIQQQLQEYRQTIQDIPYQVEESDTYYVYVFGKDAKKWMTEIKERVIK